MIGSLLIWIKNKPLLIPFITVPQPPNKTLLGCLTLLAAYLPSNADRAQATEINLEQRSQTPDLTDLEPSDTTEATAPHISPDNAAQPAFAADSAIQPEDGPENRLALTIAQDKNRSSKLEHLVATTLRKPSVPPAQIAFAEPEETLQEVVDLEGIATDIVAEPMASEPAVIASDIQQDLASVQGVEDSDFVGSENGQPIELASIGGLADVSEGVQNIPQEPLEMAQLPIEPPRSPANSDDQQILEELLLEDGEAASTRSYQSSPAITISNPSGFGADNFTGFVGVGYQSRTRFGNKDDGGLVVGVGLGDARENVGVQLSYTVASFGGSREFGTGGFNAKLHKRLADDWSVALGWEGFATTGFVDFEDSIYGSVSHIVRTRESITDPFSRVALTAGVGSGRFRLEDDVFDDRDTVGVFGSMAVRVVEPVSAIVEWTGQDLALGLSITPFRDLPIVLLPAVRDIAGAGDGGRFVMGAGVSFQL